VFFKPRTNILTSVAQTPYVSPAAAPAPRSPSRPHGTANATGRRARPEAPSACNCAPSPPGSRIGASLYCTHLRPRPVRSSAATSAVCCPRRAGSPAARTLRQLRADCAHTPPASCGLRGARGARGRGGARDHSRVAPAAVPRGAACLRARPARPVSNGSKGAPVGPPTPPRPPPLSHYLGQGSSALPCRPCCIPARTSLRPTRPVAHAPAPVAPVGGNHRALARRDAQHFRARGGSIALGEQNLVRAVQRKPDLPRPWAITTTPPDLSSLSEAQKSFGGEAFAQASRRFPGAKLLLRHRTAAGAARTHRVEARRRCGARRRGALQLLLVNPPPALAATGAIPALAATGAIRVPRARRLQPLAPGAPRAARAPAARAGSRAARRREQQEQLVEEVKWLQELALPRAPRPARPPRRRPRPHRRRC